LPEYRIGWPAGEEKMLLVSIGTGLCESEDLSLKVRQMKLLYNLQALPAALMRCATNEQDLLCRVFGRLRRECDVPEWDSEIGDLVDNDSPLREKLFSYRRYNVELSWGGLRKLGLCIDPKLVQPLDGTNYLDELRTVGRAAAARITAKDFAGFLSAREERLA
jgi:uncharacterized protein